jgi:hypothetical protein
MQMNPTVDLKAIDLVNADQVLMQALREARVAAEDAYQQVGERDACGFAWVKVHDVRSNSKLGKLLAQHGFRKAWNGGLELWDPAGFPTQSISVKEAGAMAYAHYIQVELGLSTYAGSRLD